MHQFTTFPGVPLSSHVIVPTLPSCVRGQDSAASLPPAQASGALELAAKRYREALERFPGHAEAAYNLATCISEQAALQDTYERQVRFLKKRGRDRDLVYFKREIRS